MEELPIQPGICATRIRCYTEGTIQRPPKSRSGCSPAGGTLFKSVSSVQLAHNATREPWSSSSQHELNKSCDFLQGRVKRLSRRTFVSSVNIALVKSPPQRKMSLPGGALSQQHGDKLKPFVELPKNESCKSAIVSDGTRDQQMNSNAEDTLLRSVDEKNLLDFYPNKENLPWEISDEFPHIPVLRRIQQFEKQTTPNSRSSSPGRWKLKGKTNYKKGSVHSSPALSRKNSIDEKLFIKNSRNSSPAILHSDILRFQQESNNRTLSQVGNSSSKMDSFRSELQNSEVQKGVTSPQVDACTTEPLFRSEIIKAHQERGISEQGHTKSPTNSNDGSSTADQVSYSHAQGEERDLSMDVDSQSVEIVLESINQDFPTEKGSEQHVNENNSMESSHEELVNCERTPTRDETTNGIAQENKPDCSLSKDEVTELSRSGSRSTDSFCLNANRSIGKDLRDQGSSVSVDTFVLEPLHVCDDSSESNAEQQTDDGRNASLTGKDTLNLSGSVVDASGDASLSPSSDCQPAGQSLTLSPGNKSMVNNIVSMIQGASSNEEVLGVQCNRLDLPPECLISQTAEHCQSDFQSENPDPIQPPIGEILQASHCIDTDIYSQRCSQQLGEFRTDSAVCNTSTASGQPMEELPIGGLSPCLSDCYSSSSDEESQLASGTSISDTNTNASIKPLSSSSEKDLPKEDTDQDLMHETNSDKAELPLFFTGAQTSKSLSIDEDPKEEPKELGDCHSNPDTDDSLSSSSSDSDSSDCIQAVSKPNHLLHLPSALGACGGLLPSSEMVAIHSSQSDDKIAFSRHLSALLNSRENNADQALFLSRINLLLDWIRGQPSPALEVRSPIPVPPTTPNSDSRVQELQGDIQSPSIPDTKTSQFTVSPVPPVDSTSSKDLPQHAVKRKETEVVSTKPIKRSRQKKYIDPDKYSHLRYLILQSPLVLSDEDDSDSDDSDVELNEFGEVKQDYPLGRVPDYIVAQIFCNLITKDLAALKCACKDFKWLIEKFDIKGTDSKWSEESPYREDPCMQCGKIRDPRGDVSLCRWHPKIYYKNGEIGRHYWTCCFANEEDAPGCTTSLHNNKWSGPHFKLCKVPRSWRQYWRSYPMDS